MFSFWKLICLLLLVAIPFCQQLQARNFTIDYDHNTFLKDGQPFRYISGSLHYMRVPSYYWSDRLQKMYAAGLDAVQTYITWNAHEPMPGMYNFTGDRDLIGFLKKAQDAGLLVVLRAGPYICGEWDFGGFPPWILKGQSDIIFRTMNPVYIQAVDRWLNVLLPMVKPMLYENGGPIIMVQPENEYGSYFSCDHDYMRYLEHTFRKLLGPTAVLFTTDGNNERDLKCGALQGMYATVDFGVTLDPADSFKPQRVWEPEGPLVNSEFYTGWLDHWNQTHASLSSEVFSQSLNLLLNYSANVNMYMFEGGTNFGYWNGANYPKFQPVPTSYDYDAPLTEAGDITEKYLAIRQVISKYKELPSVPVPLSTPKGVYGNLFMKFLFTIQDALQIVSLQEPIRSKYPIAMEDIGQFFGFTLYRHVLEKNYTEEVQLDAIEIRDRAYIMIDGVPIGILVWQQTSVLTMTGLQGQCLDILVENQGHINFGFGININKKGIIQNVTILNETLQNWEMYPINLGNLNVRNSLSSLRSYHISLNSAASQLSTPSLYTGLLNLPAAEDRVLDTYLDMHFWTKGQVFINGFNLGRYWPKVGPQVTLYVPRSILQPGVNTVTLFELESAPCCDGCPCLVSFIDQPIINRTITLSNLKH